MGDAGVGGRLSRSRWRTRTMVHPIPSHCRSVWRGDDRLMGPHPSATSKRTDRCRCPNRHRVTPVGRHRTVRSGRSRNLSPSGVGMTLIGRRRTRLGLAVEVASPPQRGVERRTGGQRMWSPLRQRRDAQSVTHVTSCPSSYGDRLVTQRLSSHDTPTCEVRPTDLSCGSGQRIAMTRYDRDPTPPYAPTHARPAVHGVSERSSLPRFALPCSPNTCSSRVPCRNGALPR